MQTNHPEFLRQYYYDPLDRLVASSSSEQETVLRFYQKERLATEIQGTVQRSIMQHDDQLLAEQEHQGSTTLNTSLLATDQQRSVLNVVAATGLHPFVYTPYGHRTLGNGLLSLPGFNGERQDPVTGWYLLGSFRAFNPVMMRFNRPDGAGYSPFKAGGLNTYAYCAGNPVDRHDPTGHFSFAGVTRAIMAARRLKLPTKAPSTIRPQTLLELSAQKFSSKQFMSIAEADNSYLNLFKSAERKFGDSNLKLFLSKSKGTWLERADLAASGNAPGFFEQRVQPFITHVLKFEHSVGTISHLKPSSHAPDGARLLQRNIRTEVKEAKASYDLSIMGEIANI